MITDAPREALHGAGGAYGGARLVGGCWWVEGGGGVVCGEGMGGRGGPPLRGVRPSAHRRSMRDTRDWYKSSLLTVVWLDGMRN